MTNVVIGAGSGMGTAVAQGWLPAFSTTILAIVALTAAMFVPVVVSEGTRGRTVSLTSGPD